jgi:hypothetical protein
LNSLSPLPYSHILFHFIVENAALSEKKNIKKDAEMGIVIIETKRGSRTKRNPHVAISGR